MATAIGRAKKIVKKTKKSRNFCDTPNFYFFNKKKSSVTAEKEIILAQRSTDYFSSGYQFIWGKWP
jgi:hypothetical protein